MVQQTTIDFLNDIAANNNKPWFDAHKAQYEAAKSDFESFIGAVLRKMTVVEPSFEAIAAKDCIMRIYRDVRFSKDKSPYKSNFAAVLSKDGRKMQGAAYYVHLEPEKCFVGGGIWQPEPTALKKIRQEIDYNFNEFLGIVTEAAFVQNFGEMEGERLKSVPKEYNADNLAAHYLKFKSFTFGRKFSNSEITGENSTQAVSDSFTTLKPFIDFLNRAIA
jgi:uncharacterized protein (TIGR02453 family)